MIPPMKQQVTAYVPIIDDNGRQVTDKYGKPKTETEKSKARVQFKSQTVVDAKGIERNVSLEVDLPPAFNPSTGTELGYTTNAGYEGIGTISAKEEIINLTGSKVYYRTVYINV